MNYEKRLFLAVGLSMGILILWSTLTPPPEKKAIVLDQRTMPELSAPVEAPEPTGEFQFGPYRLAVSLVHGGIRSMEFNGEPLIKDAKPGFLELREAGSSTAVGLTTRRENGDLVSEGMLQKSGLAVRRRIRWARERHPHLLESSVEIWNGSTVPVESRFGLAVYKPLVALREEEKKYLAGIAWLGKKQESIRVVPGQQRSLTGLPHWVVSQGKSEAVVVGIPRVEGGMFHVEHPTGGQAAGWVELGPILIAAGERADWQFPIYVGPMVLAELKKLGMEGTLSFGAFSGITRWLLRFLSWSEEKFHSYGWSICFLSIAVWLPFSPLTWYGMRMTQQMTERMAAIKPQETRIRKEHQGNPQKTQKELMELYRKHGVNPTSGCIGCLPLLLTWPIYIALFEVLTRAPELRGASFFWIQDLALPDSMIRFPATLPFLGNHLNVLPFLAAGATFVQQKAMQKPSAGMTEEQKVQQQMMKMFPLMFILFFYGLPSGFMLYWVTNSLLMGGQQVLLSRVKSR